MLVMRKVVSADGDDHGVLLLDSIMCACIGLMNVRGLLIWLLCQAAKHRFGVGGSAVSDG